MHPNELTGYPQELIGLLELQTAPLTARTWNPRTHASRELSEEE
jgi:hypothetical protein